MKGLVADSPRNRDSLFGDPVVWSGTPKVLATPALYRGAAAVCGVSATIATASAVVVATTLRASPATLLIFASWMTTLAFAFAFGPRWWRSELEYIVTERHVVVRRGRLRRSIDRRAISFARIHWDPKHVGIGDLELVRAVQMGALRRGLSVRLSGLVAPDRVWAIIRGVTPPAPAGSAKRLLAQRLDDGERVVWSSHPTNHWRKWLPNGGRALLSVGIGIGLSAVAVSTSFHSVHGLRIVLRAGLRPESLPFIALVASVVLTVILLATASVGVVYASLVRPARLQGETRYLITNRRVLIQRGDEELHLDRSRIVDVIDAPGHPGLKDLFLVLDGPRARALAPSGAFGEVARGLQPVLHAIPDADVVSAILRSQDNEPLRSAA